jgi:ribosomal protein S1
VLEVDAERRRISLSLRAPRVPGSRAPEREKTAAR